MLVTNPVFVVKTRMCLQFKGHPDAYRGLAGAHNGHTPPAVAPLGRKP